MKPSFSGFPSGRGSEARRTRCAVRRVHAAAVLIALAVLVGGAPAARSQTGAAADGVPGLLSIGLVSRDEVLRDARAARELTATESRMMRQLQATIDAAKTDLAREEQELTQIKSSLDPGVFDARALDFDRRVRRARQAAQDRVLRLRRGFQQARNDLAAALPAVLERLRRERGLDIIVDAGAVLAAERGLLLTDEARAIFDISVPQAPLPVIDVTAPLLGPDDVPSADE